MKLATIFEAAAYKQLVTVDLPNRGSHQHELNGVGALQTFFGTDQKTQGTIKWAYFMNGSEPEIEEGEFTFYDARAKSAALTGRSEWRFYYKGDFLSRAKVGDLFVLVRSKGQLFGLIFRKGSTSSRAAQTLFRIDKRALKFDSVASDTLKTVELPPAEESPVSRWVRSLSPRESDPRHVDEFVHRLPFKPRARMLILLGDQLIRDSGIAVFELVKNAYDADAQHAWVTLSNVKDRHSGQVIVEDDGSGMNWDQVVNVWLEPGTDYRQQQKSSGYRTPKFNRLPLGEKGVGRFAAHKLGRRISLITRQQDSPEVVVDIDWEVFATARYLEDAKVSVKQRQPSHFTGNATGTRIEITNLNEELSRGVIRQIFRSVNSICSPFRGPSDFVAKLDVVPNDHALSGLLDISRVLEIAPYRATCMIEGSALTYDYEFAPPASMDRISGRLAPARSVPAPATDLFSHALDHAIGPILIEFRIYDLDSQTLAYSVSDKKGFKDFLRFNGGVRVYRDGVRVYDYGEPGNDWLDLGGSRVNDPTAKVSNNQIIGAVHLDGKGSSGLVEKTNREGFVEDETFRVFRDAIRFALTQIAFERNADKARLRQLYSSKKHRQPVISELADLREAVARVPAVAEELMPLVDGVEAKYVEMRDTLMTAAGAGLTLSIVIHEVEKAIAGLTVAIERKAPIEELGDLAIHLNELIDGLTYLTRKSGRHAETFSDLVVQTIRNTRYRTEAHKIHVTNGIEAGDPDISVRCTKRLIIATLMNLIDNSIYWLSTKDAKNKRIYLGSSAQLLGGPTLFVADNGPGFQDPPDILTQPFMTRRPDGMGLGLHVAASIMESHDGKLVFPSFDELGLSEEYSGAIVGLQFKE